MVRKLAVIFVILASLSFFNLKFLGNAVVDIGQILGLGIIIGLILIHLAYDQRKKLVSGFNIEISLVLLSVILSMFGAYMFHNQSFGTTALFQRATYFFLFFYFLYFIRIHPDDILKLMFWFSIVYAFLYLLQFILYPTIIIDCRIVAERGTVRIFMPGSGYAFFIYFFALASYFKTKNFKYILLCILMLGIFVLSGTRQLLGSVVFITFLFLIFTKQIKSKATIILLISASLIPLYFVFQEVFVSLFQVSLDQSVDSQNDVRVRAAKFFIIDFFPNPFSYIIGNGAYSPASDYGRQIVFYQDNFGYYLADIGMIGEYSMYGLLFVLAELTILLKVIFMKLPEPIKFIRYLFIAQLMLSFTGGGGFSLSQNVVAICLWLYLIDAYKAIETTNISKTDAKISNTYSSI